MAGETKALPAFQAIIAEAPAGRVGKVTELMQALSKVYADKLIEVDRGITEAAAYARAALAFSRGEPGASAAALEGFSAEVVLAFADALRPIAARVEAERAAKIAAEAARLAARSA